MSAPRRRTELGVLGGLVEASISSLSRLPSTLSMCILLHLVSVKIVLNPRFCPQSTAIGLRAIRVERLEAEVTDFRKSRNCGEQYKTLHNLLFTSELTSIIKNDRIETT